MIKVICPQCKGPFDADINLNSMDTKCPACGEGFHAGAALSEHDWEAVSWIQRWHDWYEVASRPGLLRDSRILPALATEISRLPSYPTSIEFQKILKELSAAFPTRQMRNSSVLAESVVKDAIHRAIRRGLQ